MSCSSCQQEPCTCEVIKIPKGDPGTPGSQIFCGTGTPSPSLGINGDWFLDTATQNLYQKINGTWGIKVNLQGPTGPAGADGNDGNDGVDGATGPAGPAGANGADGTDGDDGLGYVAQTTTSGETIPGVFPTTISLTGLTPTSFAYLIGSRVRFANPADPVNEWMEGVVTAVGSGSITASIDSSNGAGASSSSWNVSIAGEPGALSNIASAEVSGLSSECLTFADDQLSTILQEIIDNLCNLSTVTLGPAEKDYLFKAKKAATQTLGAAGTEYVILFEDDATAGETFDFGGTWSGSNWEDDKATSLKFILTDLTVTNNSGVNDAQVKVRITKNGTELVSTTVTAASGGGTATIGLLETAVESLVAGDDIRVTIDPDDTTPLVASGDVVVSAGAIFYNIDGS